MEGGKWIGSEDFEQAVERFQLLIMVLMYNEGGILN